MASFLAPQPRVCVLPPGVEWKGLDAADDDVPLAPVVDLHEAMTREWEGDAHFLTYLPAGDVPSRFDEMARCNKPSLFGLLQKGIVLQAVVVQLEWDTGKGPTHVEWTQTLWENFHEKLEALRKSNHPFGKLLDQVAYSYSTRRGWRWTWVYSKGVPVAESEPLARGIAAVAVSAGLDVDTSGSVVNWAQPFRLPRVMRKGRKTSADPFAYFDAHPERRLDPATVAPVGKPDSSHTHVGGPQPSDSEAEDLLHTRNARNVPAPTDFYRHMKKQLKGKVLHAPCYPYVFENKALDVPQGERHETIRGWVMTTTSIALRTYPGAMVQQVYALFCGVAGQIEERNGRADTWRSCTGAWAKVTAEIEEEGRRQAEEAQAKALDVVQASQGIKQGVGGWAPKVVEVFTPVQAQAWVKKRMILKEKRAKRYWIMRRDGTYGSEPVDEGSLIPQVLQQGMGHLIDVMKETKEGPRPKSVSDLSVEYVTNISEVIMRCEIPGSYIENPDDEESPRLVALSFRRNPKLTPCYSADVDLWLHALGGRNYDQLCRHIGVFLAWDRGSVAAMSFSLDPGAGKKVLVQGFEEVLEIPRSASGEDLIQKHNAKLQYTPYIFVNEGLPDARHGMHHASDTLRKAVTGDYLNYEPKGRDAVNISFPYRVLLTANGWRLIDALGAGRDLTPSERLAIGQRLIHYPTEKDVATKLLAQKGGERWTRGWVKGVSGEPSDYVVARHFLYLWEQHGKNAQVEEKGGRLLIAGDPNQAAIRRLRTRGGSTPALIETIRDFLNSPMLATSGDADAENEEKHVLETSDHRLFMTFGGILDYWKNHSSHKGSSERLTMAKVKAGLKGILLDDASDGDDFGGETAVRSIEGRKGRWHEIDVPLLFREIQGFGWTCKRLQDIMVARGLMPADRVHKQQRVLALPAGGV